MEERLQKVLARAGLGSRREIEGWIRAGRIQVNGSVAELGSKITGQETILLDGNPLVITAPDVVRVIAYHKPIGELATRRDPEGRPTIFDHLPRLQQGRWISVGRLDFNTSGLLLLTNDGELANLLMHPAQELEREYAVRVFGEVDGLILERLLQGVQLDDGMARFTGLRDAGGRGANHWYHVVLAEGRNREVRRLWESQGVQVSRLTRVRYGPVELGRRLPAGSWRDLRTDELQALRAAAGITTPREQPKPKTPKSRADSAPRPGKNTPAGAKSKARAASPSRSRNPRSSKRR